MKNFTLLILVTCMNFSDLFAQNPWALFPENQPTYWQVNDEIKLYYNDFTHIGSFTDRHYFGAVYYFENVDHPCFDTILTQHFGLQDPPVDTLFSTPDYWFVLTPDGDLPFYHLAEPGFSWSVPLQGAGTFDEIVFKCDTKTEELIFGEPDSVKTYLIETKLNGATIQSGLSDIQFKLSKQRGFLAFTPLQKLTEPGPEVYEMVGFNDGQPHGFTSRFEDYFGGLEPGQVLKWKEDFVANFNFDYFDTQLFYFDSILSVNLTNEKIELTYFRKGISKNWHWHPTHQPEPDTVFAFETVAFDTFYRQHFDPWTTKVPGWFTMPSFGVLDYTLLSDIFVDSIGLKSLVLTDNENTYYQYGNECYFSIADGCNLYRQVTTGLGMTYYLYGCFFSGRHSKQLLGYTLDGSPYGDLDPVSSIFEMPTPNIRLDVFPNPASTAIRVNIYALQPVRFFTLKITDATGKIYRIKNSFEAMGEIDVSSLPSGLYFISVESDGFFGREKFVKW